MRIQKNQRNIPLCLNKFGEFLLSFKQDMHDRFSGTEFVFTQFDGPKLELPWFDGFIRKGKRSLAMIVTLDVDTQKGQEALQAAVAAYKGTLPFFKSYSHSGKLKIHVIVDLAEGELKGNRFHVKKKLRVDAEKAAIKIARIIGFDPSYIDRQGILRLFITESFYWNVQEVRETITDAALQALHDQTMAEQARAKALAKLDSSSSAVKTHIDHLNDKLGVKGWAAKDEQHQEEVSRSLQWAVKSAKAFIADKFDTVRAQFPELSDTAIKCLLLYIAACNNGTAWLSSKIGISLLSERNFYEARKELQAAGVLRLEEKAIRHEKAAVFSFAEELTAFAVKVKDKVRIFAGNMKEKFEQFLANGGGPGSYNCIEVALCIQAALQGLSYLDVVALLMNDPTWCMELCYRSKRVKNTFKWASQYVRSKGG